MRILLENGTYGCHNAGDLAMMQVAANRLRKMWPQSELLILNDEPQKLQRVVPDARPVPLAGREAFFQPRNIFGGVHRLVPVSASRWLQGAESRLRRAWTAPTTTWIGRRLSRRGVDVGPMRRFVEALTNVDAVAATGGGYLTDAFEAHATWVLETLRFASETGKPVAMFGQGIGPLESPALRRLAAEVLPTLSLIALREDLAGPELLRSLGVDDSRVLVTGDDAIELAYDRREPVPGNATGFNLRLSYYSAVESDLIKTVCQTVLRIAQERTSPILPVPISWHEEENDLDSLLRWIPLDDQAVEDARTFATPLQLVRQVARCRIVVTGSYHAAVFALSQGIPVVGLAKSEYYRHKFDGLAAQFGPGCDVVVMQGDDVAGRLEAAMQGAWNAPPEIRESLLQAARRQICAGCAAYERFRLFAEKRDEP